MGIIMNFDNENEKLEFAEYLYLYLHYEQVHHSVDLNNTDLTHIIYNAIEAFKAIMKDNKE